MNKNVKRIVKQNQHLLKENLHVTILQNNLPTAIDAISTCSFTAIKSSSKPLILKDNNQSSTITAAVINNNVNNNNTNGNAVPLNRNNNRKAKRFDKDKLEYYYLQFLIFFACIITFGLLPPLQPFSCLPVSHSTLKYSVILSGLSYPVGCSIAIFFKCRSTKGLTLLTLLAAFIAAFIFYSALHSPDLPPILNFSILKPQQQQQTNSTTTLIFNSDSDFSLNGTEYEDSNFYKERDENTALKRFLMHIDRHQSVIISVFMISCWVIFNLILSYVKTMVTIQLNDKNGQEGLFYVGLFSNLGSFLSSAFMFIAVNHLTWFKQK